MMFVFVWILCLFSFYFLICVEKSARIFCVCVYVRVYVLINSIVAACTVYSILCRCVHTPHLCTHISTLLLMFICCGMCLTQVHFLPEASPVINRVILLSPSYMSPSIQEQREQVKKSYQRLLTILDALEDKLLPGRAEKRRQKQSKERTVNVTDSLSDTSPLQV